MGLSKGFNVKGGGHFGIAAAKLVSACKSAAREVSDAAEFLTRASGISGVHALSEKPVPVRIRNNNNLRR